MVHSGVMCLSLVRAVYIESCSLSFAAGLRVVKEGALGGNP